MVGRIRLIFKMRLFPVKRETITRVYLFSLSRKFELLFQLSEGNIFLQRIISTEIHEYEKFDFYTGTILHIDTKQNERNS